MEKNLEIIIANAEEKIDQSNQEEDFSFYKSYPT